MGDDKEYDENRREGKGAIGEDMNIPLSSLWKLPLASVEIRTKRDMSISS